MPAWFRGIVSIVLPITAAILTAIGMIAIGLILLAFDSINRNIPIVVALAMAAVITLGAAGAAARAERGGRPPRR